MNSAQRFEGRAENVLPGFALSYSSRVGRAPEKFRSYIWLTVGLIVSCAISGAPGRATKGQTDEEVIRNVVMRVLDRLNKGDFTAVAEFWDDNADYVGVDGVLTKGRANIQALFSQMAKSIGGQERASIEQIRFITPEVATVDGSWTVTGARGADGRELPPIKGRGFEVLHKKGGRWRFVSTREMVVFRGI